MRSRRLARPLPSLLVVSSLVACSDRGVVETGDDDRFEPVCGQDGPVVLATAEADEDIRWLSRVDGSDDLHVRIDARGTPAPGEPPDIRAQAVIDECGDPVADVVVDVGYLRWRQGVLFGCMAGDLVRLEGYDDPAPSILARGDCSPSEVGEWWVALDAEDDAETGRLVSIEVEGSSVRARPIVDEVAFGGGSHGYQLSGDEIFVQTPELAVEQVDPRTGARARVLEQVDDGRWHVRGDVVVYQGPRVDPAVPSPLVVRSRATGAEQTVSTTLPVDWFSLEDDVLHTTSVVPPSEQRFQWFELDPLRPLALPEGTGVAWRQADGTLALTRYEPGQPGFEVLLWSETEPVRALFDCPDCRLTLSFFFTEHTDMLFARSSPVRDEVWRFEHAGGPPVYLGERTSTAEVLDDGRVLSVRVGDDGEHGPLQLWGDQGEPVTTLDDDVTRRSIDFTLGLRAPGEVAYAAIEGDGSLTLLRARLAPRP